MRLVGGRSCGEINVDSWQISHLVLGESESNAIFGVFHGVDRNGDRLFAPEVTFVQQDVGHVMVAGIDDEASDPSDGAVRRVYLVAAALIAGGVANTNGA